MVKEKKPDRQPRQPKVYHALIVFGVLIAIMSVGIIVYGSNVHVPMFCGVIAAALMALWLGFKWETIEKAMMDGIYNALQAAIILMIVGVLIGVWIVSGVVPAMIYYGLKLLSPSIFLVAAVLICSVTSLATGTSWGTMGTMGLALMGIAVGLDIPAPMAAGAIISGAYFGDKISPLSDTTNLAPAMAGTDVMTHVKFMLLPTGIAYGLTLIIFGILGGIYVHSGNAADMSAVSDMSSALASEFCLSPVLLLPPLIVILAVAFKIPAIPGITLGIIAGALLGPVFQGADCGLGVLLEAGMSGYVSDTGIEAIDSLLTTGGIENMLSSVSLTLIAMMFGGIMEKTGQLEVVVNRIIALAKSPAALVGTTELTCVLSNATMPEQYISIVVPGRMYAEAYREQGLHPKTLSNALESSGTVTSALIPWNTCGVFIFATLGISTVSYLPFAFFNWLMPVITFALACAGLTVAGADGKRLGRKGKVRKQIPETTEER